MESDVNKTNALVRIKPMTLFLLTILSGILLGLVLPLSFLPQPWGASLGLIALGTGLLLTLGGDKAFKKQGTAVNPDQPPTSLVTGGWYKISRNTMYLGMVSLQIGMALVLSNGGLLLTLIPAGLITHQTIIPPEERCLEEIFGQRYRDYKASVRRWI